MTIPTPPNGVDHEDRSYDAETAPEDVQPSNDRPRENPAPQTGHQEIDGALQGLGDLDGEPLDTHHDRLASAHETLHRALHPDQNDQA